VRTAIHRRPWILPLLLVALVAFLACNGGKGPSTAGPDGGTPGQGSPGPNGNGEAPSPTPPKLPEGLLTEFPQYAGAKLVSADATDNQLKAEFRTSDPPEDIISFFKGIVEKDPWVLVTVLDPDENTTVIFFSGLQDPDISGAVAVQRISPDSDEVRIQVDFTIGVLTPTPSG